MTKKIKLESGKTIVTEIVGASNVSTKPNPDWHTPQAQKSRLEDVAGVVVHGNMIPKKEEDR